MILGIETSCDECSAAVLEACGDELRVHRTVTMSQIKLHEPYGGVVPEIASRDHCEHIDSVIYEAGIDRLAIDAIAVTVKPGLIGSLLVGVTAAKALAYMLKKPLVPIHHLEGHTMSVYLGKKPEMAYPALLVLASGGHTFLSLIKRPPELWGEDECLQNILGRSKDDALGEAFDKIAKVMGLPYPGGPLLEELARGGNVRAFDLPRPLAHESSYDLSFSGLKTAAALCIARNPQAKREDLAASIQEALCESLMIKVRRAFVQEHCQSLILVGGVAANQYLRAKCLALTSNFIVPALQYCTDNGAMIAAAGYYRWRQGRGIVGQDLITLCASALA